MLRSRVRLIRRCHDAVQRRYRNQTQIPAACEWLLDNWYLVRRESLSIAGELRRAKRLRFCEEGPMVFALCRSLVRAGHGMADEGRCKSFLDGFQSITVLRRVELALFPACLEVACLAEIADVCREMPYSADLDALAVRLVSPVRAKTFSASTKFRHIMI